jgi:hypothetical protein
MSDATLGRKKWLGRPPDEIPLASRVGARVGRPEPAGKVRAQLGRAAQARSAAGRGQARRGRVPSRELPGAARTREPTGPGEQRRRARGGAGRGSKVYGPGPSCAPLPERRLRQQQPRAVPGSRRAGCDAAAGLAAGGGGGGRGDGCGCRCCGAGRSGPAEARARHGCHAGKRPLPRSVHRGAGELGGWGQQADGVLTGHGLAAVGGAMRPRRQRGTAVA